jgi:putative FmdB family regulatory protein
MPLYEYECETCAQRFERIQKFSDPLVDKCPSCGGPVRKLLSSPAIQFKGSGWYITDYPKKGSGKDTGDAGGKSSKDGAESSKSETTTGKESSPTETKPATPAKSD